MYTLASTNLLLSYRFGLNWITMLHFENMNTFVTLNVTFKSQCQSIMSFW